MASLASALLAQFPASDLESSLFAFLASKFEGTWPCSPPVDLGILAEEVGMSTILEVPELHGSGMLVDQGAVEAIFVSATDVEGKRRFTIAHELMHVLFRWFQAKDRDPWDDEERLCELGASILLVPPVDDWLRLGKRRPSAELIRSIKDTYSISYDAAAVTMATRRSESFLVGYWQLNANDGLTLLRAYRSQTFPSRIWLPLGLELPATKPVSRWVSGFSGARPTDTYIANSTQGKELLYADYLRLGSEDKRFVLSVFTPRA